MRKLITILALFFCLKSSATNYHFSSGSILIIDDLNSPGFLPGDTLFLDSANASTHGYIYLANLRGSYNAHIVITNYGYSVNPCGIEIDGWSQYVDILGTRPVGSATKNKNCGLGFYGQYPEVDYTNGGLAAVHIHGHSKNIRVLNVEIKKVKYAFQMKNDYDFQTLAGGYGTGSGQYDSTLMAGMWVIDSIEIGYNYIHKCESQGMYIGNTEPDNSITHSRPVSVAGTTIYPNPGYLGNLWIHDNYIDTTGRASIQISNARVGTTVVERNTMLNSGGQLDEGQGGGATMGGYVRAYVDSNTARYNYTWDYINYGVMFRAWANTGDSAGFTLHQGVDTIARLYWGTNMTLETRATYPVDSTSVWVWNNTFTNSSLIINNDPFQKHSIGVSNSPATWSINNRESGNTYGGSGISYGGLRFPTTSGVSFSGTPDVQPVVNAGWDYTNGYRVTDADTVLNGSGRALNGRTVTSKVWSQVSGPNTATIASSTSYQTAVSGLVTGTYVFRLTVTDSNGSVMTDDTSVQVGNGYSFTLNYRWNKPRNSRIRIIHQ